MSAEPRTIEHRIARLRAMVPTPMLPALWGLRSRVAWRSEGVRDDARAQMRFLLPDLPEAELDDVARAYVRYQARRGELRWHPELLLSLRVEGMEHLLAARAQDRGVLLNFIHHGYYDGGFPSIARLGAPGHIVVYPYMLEPDAPLWLQQHVRIGSANGGTATSAAIGTEGLVALLQEGNVVAIASDVPGRTPIKLFGREVLGSFGAARLPMATGSPVVVMTSEEDEQGPFIRLHEALQPGDYETPQALLEAMFAIHEEVVLRWPEAYDLPLSRFGLPEDAGDA